MLGLFSKYQFNVIVVLFLIFSLHITNTFAGGIPISPITSNSNTNTFLPFLQTFYTKAYKHFSNDLISLEPKLYQESDNSNIEKITGLAPFAIGHLLAAIAGQKYWELSTNTKHGFQKAMRLPEDKIADAYSFLLSKVNPDNDPNTFGFSSIFAAEKLEKNEDLSKLGTEVVDLTDSWDGSASTVINTQIRIETFNKIYEGGELVPSADWAGPGIGNHTRSVFTNTLTYSNNWETYGREMKPIGQQTFTSKSQMDVEAKKEVDFIGYRGPVGINDEERYLSVGIPLKDDVKKVFVLVQPKEGIETITTEDLNRMATSRPLSWASLPKSLEFPKINASFYYSPVPQLKKMGIDSTFCDLEQKHENFLQQISQRLYLQVDEQGIIASSATGVELDNTEEYKMAAGEATPLLATEIPPLPEITPQQPTADKSIPNNKIDEVDSEFSTPQLIRFDKPFFWYLHDDKLDGPLFFGSVLSVKNLKQLLEPEDYDFALNLQSVMRWSCHLKSNIPNQADGSAEE